MPNDNLVLWAATVRTKNFEERLEAAVAGSFARMSLFPLDVTTYTAQGLTISDLLTMAGDRGIEISTLDPFTKWLPKWEPPVDWSREDYAFADFDEETFLRMAETLGVRSVNLIEPFGYMPLLEVAIESFAAFCDRAAVRGLRVHLEAMAVSGINRLTTAWEIVRQASRSNGGLLLDTWHYYRAGAEPEVLERIPGECIFEIQLADAGAQVQGSLMNDLMHHRLLPGEGSLPLEHDLEG